MRFRVVDQPAGATRRLDPIPRPWGPARRHPPRSAATGRADPLQMGGCRRPVRARSHFRVRSRERARRGEQAMADATVEHQIAALESTRAPARTADGDTVRRRLSHAAAPAGALRRVRPGSPPTRRPCWRPARPASRTSRTGTASRYWERECLVEDAMLFRDLARSRVRRRDALRRDRRPARAAAPATASSWPRRATATSCAPPSGSAAAPGACVDLFRDQSPRAVHRHATSTWSDRSAPVIGCGACAGCRPRSNPGVGAGVADGPGTALFDARANLISLDEQRRALFAETRRARPGRRGPLPMTPVYRGRGPRGRRARGPRPRSGGAPGCGPPPGAGCRCTPRACAARTATRARRR